MLLLCTVQGIGLAQVGLGAWLWIFSKEFKIVLGEPVSLHHYRYTMHLTIIYPQMRNAFVGYMIIGCIVFLTCKCGNYRYFMHQRCIPLILDAMLPNLYPSCVGLMGVFSALLRNKYGMLLVIRITFLGSIKCV